MSRSHHAWRKTLTRSLGAANFDQRIYLGGPGESQSCTANPGPSILALNAAIPGRIARPKRTSRKTKTAGGFTACGGQVGAPHELFARPPLSPLFHLYTLAPLYLRPQSCWSSRFCYWALAVHKTSRPPDRGQATAWTLRQNAKPEEYGRRAIFWVWFNIKSDPNGIRTQFTDFVKLRDFNSNPQESTR